MSDAESPEQHVEKAYPARFLVIEIDPSTGNVRVVTQHTSRKKAEERSILLTKHGITHFIRPESHDVRPQTLLGKRWCGDAMDFVAKGESIDDVRMPLLHAVRQKADEVIHGPLETPIGILDGDAGSQRVIETMVRMIEAGHENPHGGQWRMADNTFAPISDSDIVEISRMLFERRSVAMRKKWSICDAIRNEEDILALKAFDLETEWNNA